MKYDATSTLGFFSYEFLPEEIAGSQYPTLWVCQIQPSTSWHQSVANGSIISKVGSAMRTHVSPEFVRQHYSRAHNVPRSVIHMPELGELWAAYTDTLQFVPQQQQAVG